MRISSPCWSRCEDQMRSPLTDVPFDDPRSLTHQPAAKRSRTACRRLAVGSSSSGTSFSGALPIVTRSASSGIRQLRTPEITSICGATVASSLRRWSSGAMSEPLVGGRLLGDRYEVLELLGAGGEARVVKALDHRHQRPVALKIRRVRGAPGARGAARRGPPAARARAAPGAAAGPRGLLRRGRVRRRDGLGRRDRPRADPGRAGNARPGALERGGLPRRGR